MKPNIKNKICYVTSVDVTIKFILLNQLRFLKREGYNVYVACALGKWKDEIEKEDVMAKDIKFKRKISPISDLFALIKLFFYFKKEKFDVVHTHTPKAGLIGQLAAKMAGVPVIVNTVHGFYFQKNDSRIKRIFFILTEKIAAKCSDLIFFVNKEDMKTAEKEKICSLGVMRYFGGGIDMERFNPERFSEEFILEKKKQLGMNPDSRIIGIVARLVEEKGYLDLFCAFKKIIKDHPNVTLLIAGSLEPGKKDAISPDIFRKYGIEKSIVFVGERIDIDEIFAIMDIFVLPSYREGLGISIIEASAMEKPVVATNIRGCREAVEDGITGILVPAGDPQKLADAFLYLIKNSEKAIEMGKRGREKIQREFNEEIIFDRIKKEYNDLLFGKK